LKRTINREKLESNGPSGKKIRMLGVVALGLQSRRIVKARGSRGPFQEDRRNRRSIYNMLEKTIGEAILPGCE